MLIGCSRYPRIAAARREIDAEKRIHLRGPANDVALLRPIFRDRLAIPEENLRVLEDAGAQQPTRENILAELEKMRALVGPGSFVILFFAGHGAQVRDLSGDEPDGWDEVILPTNAAALEESRDRADGIENAITDDEIGAQLSALREKGAFVWTIFDCCHAGTATRGEEPTLRARYLEPHLLGGHERGMRAGDAALDRDSVADLPGVLQGGTVTLYACASHQKAYELELPPQQRSPEVYGLLSYLLARELQCAEPGMNFRELHARLLVHCQALPLSLPSRPWIEGETTATLEGLAQPLVDVYGVARDATKSAFYVEAGAWHGIAPHTKFELFARDGANERILGTLVASAVELHRCSGPVEASSGDPVAWPVTLRARVLDAPRHQDVLRLAVLGPEGRTLAGDDLPLALREAVEAHRTRYEITSHAHEADWLVELRESSFEFRSPMASMPCERFLIESRDLQATLRSIFRVHMLKRLPVIEPRVAKLPQGLQIEAWHCLKEGGGRRDLRESTVLAVGDQIEIRIQNTAEATFDIGVLNIDGKLGIRCIYFKGQSPLRLGPMDRDPIGDTLYIKDGKMGIESLIVIAVPRAVGDPLVDFQSLAQPHLREATRGGSQSEDALPLERYLLDAERGAERGPRRKKLNESMCIWTVQTVVAR
ncbi:MAG: caspase family protein [Planctomycetes bacterium]|nr:caspase family protein [Planctomycetota bacterium]